LSCCKMGEIIQDGVPDQLVRAKGAYRELVMREMTRLRLQVMEDPRIPAAVAS